MEHILVFALTGQGLQHGVYGRHNVPPLGRRQPGQPPAQLVVHKRTVPLKSAPQHLLEIREVFRRGIGNAPIDNDTVLPGFLIKPFDAVGQVLCKSFHPYKIDARRPPLGKRC